MKLIDEKGRLFGKINIVDFSIILVFLICIPAFFYIYKVLGKRPAMVPFRWVQIEAVTFTIPEFAELFKPGDVSLDELGNPDGKLLKIFKKDHAYSGRVKDAAPDKHEHTIPVFLELELLCSKNIKNNRLYHKRAQLTVNLEEGFNFITDKYGIKCFAIKIKD